MPPELDLAPGPRSAEPTEDLWDAPAEDAIDEDAPASAEDAPASEDVAPTEGSTVEEALFAAYEDAPGPPPAPEPAPEPALIPPLFDAGVAEPEPEPVADEPAAADDAGRTVRVHDDGRLDRRPGPIRMTPSEAIALAQDGPAALRRDRPHGRP